MGVILSNLYKDYNKPLYKPETQNDLIFFDGQPPSKRGSKNSNQKSGAPFRFQVMIPSTNQDSMLRTIQGARNCDICGLEKCIEMLDFSNWRFEVVEP